MPDGLIKNAWEKVELFYILFVIYSAIFIFKSEYEAECECESEIVEMTVKFTCKDSK